MQTRKLSFIESMTQTFVGFIGSFIILEIMKYLLEIEMSAQQNVLLILAFTAWSIVRNYFVRRLFNGFHEEQRLNRSASRLFNIDD